MKPRNIRDSYKLYKKENPDGVDIKTYINMCNEFNKFLIEKVLEGEEVTLPARMGTIYIFGRKQEINFDENGDVKGLAPDWVKTKKLWQNNPEAKQRKQIMYHTNESTGGSLGRHPHQQGTHARPQVEAVLPRLQLPRLVHRRCVRFCQQRGQ